VGPEKPAVWGETIPRLEKRIRSPEKLNESAQVFQGHDSSEAKFRKNRGRRGAGVYSIIRKRQAVFPEQREKAGWSGQ